jgi:hypothetical protein
MAVRSHSGCSARRRTALAACIATIGIALLASACGGGSPGAAVANVATTGTTSTTPSATSTTDDPAAFSSCMRAHGISNFPDPDSKGRIKITSGVNKAGQHTGVDPDSAVFQKAQQACKKFQPNGGNPDPKAQAAAIKQMLAFASCMRSHGVTKFPDPQVSSGGGVRQVIGPDSGVDPASPTFQAAQKACQKLQPDGMRTKGGGGPIGAGPDKGGSLSSSGGQEASP